MFHFLQITCVMSNNHLFFLQGTVDITRWFEEITTDRTALLLRPEDEDGDISKVVQLLVVFCPNYLLADK